MRFPFPAALDAKRRASGLSAALLFMLVAGISGVTPAVAQTSNAPETVTFVLPSAQGIPHSPYFVAQEMGYYKEEGLELKIVSVTGGVDAVRAVASGQAQFAFPAPSSIISARNGGLPAISVFAHRQMWIFGFSALEGKGIAKIEDLKGKTIGVISESAGSIVQLMLAGSGVVSPDEVTIQVVGANMAAPLATGAVDAIYTWRALFQQYANRGIKQVWISSPELENFQSNLIATTQDIVDQNPELVEKFLRATTKGMVFSLANPKAAVEIVGKTDPRLVADPDAAMREIRIVNEEMISPLTKAHGFGFNSEASFAKHEAAMLKLGLISAPHEAEEYYYTNRFIDAANDFDASAIEQQAKSYQSK